MHTLIEQCIRQKMIFFSRNFLLICNLTFFGVSLGMSRVNSGEELDTGVIPAWKSQQDLQNSHVYLDFHSLEWGFGAPGLWQQLVLLGEWGSICQRQIWHGCDVWAGVSAGCLPGKLHENMPGCRNAVRSSITPSV